MKQEANILGVGCLLLAAIAFLPSAHYTFWMCLGSFDIGLAVGCFFFGSLMERR